MPQIIVTAGDTADLTAGTVILRERISASDFESDRFAENLVERLGWAVSDACEVEEEEGPGSKAIAAPQPDRPSARVVTTAS